MARAAADDRLLATELADALARRGIPFRQAHEAVGRRIARAEAAGQTLAALAPADGITARDLTPSTSDARSRNAGRPAGRRPPASRPPRGRRGGSKPRRGTQSGR